MTGPLEQDDLSAEPEAPPDEDPVEVTPSREAHIGELTVRRALPHRSRRTVGAWCFVDHMGPTSGGLDIGPHPHIGLHTVTWLLSGEVLHTDSLGTEQPIRPGQLNLMTAGHGIAHAEEGRGGPYHGAQLWVAQPEATRHGPPAFAHHAELPRAELDRATATVLVGSLGDVTSPARADTPLMGAELALRPGPSEVGLDPTFEHAVVVLEGRATVAGVEVTPGHLAHLGLGRDELGLVAEEAARLLLLGGEPFEATPLMWWNYVARTPDEVRAAHDDWEAGADRFGTVPSTLARVPSQAPPAGLRRPAP